MKFAGAIMRKAFRSGSRGPWAAGFMCLALAPAAALAAQPEAPQFHIHAGDVIEIAVAGLPELRMRSGVQPDGVVTFPLLGDLKVVGLTTAQLREAAQNQLAHQIYRMRTNDGREVPVIIRADEVSASVIEYGPIYIDGDVTKPGAVPFRPGLTTRQAIALAGGVEVAALRSINPIAEASAARSDLESTNIKLAAAQARAAGIARELQDRDHLAGSTPDDVNLSAELNQFARNENDIVQARMADYVHQKEFLKASVSTLADRTTVLQKQQIEEEQGAKADDADLQSMIELLKHGNVANPRVLEARRALLMSQTRALQVADGLLQLNMQSADLSRQLQHLQDDHRAALLKEAQEARAAVAELTVKRDAARQKLDLLSLSRAHLSVEDPSRVEVTLVRQEQDGESKRTTIDGNHALEPGDVVEVSVKASEN